MTDRAADDAARNHLDAERVAALLDGRVTGAERDALLAQIADDPLWREVLADAAAVHEGSAALSSAQPSVLPIDAGARPRPRWPYALAAGVALMAGGSWWALRSPTPEPVLQLAMVEAGPATDIAVLDRWTRVRASVAPLTPRSLAVRIGALSVVLLDASRRSDSANVQFAETVRADVVALLQQVSGSGPVTATLMSARDVNAVRAALANVRVLVDTAAFDAGALLEIELSRGSLRDARLERVRALLGELPGDQAVARDAAALLRILGN